MTDLSKYTKENLIASQLERVSNLVDKREGSIIYDTTAPVAVELSTYYENLIEMRKQAYASTATGAYLDLKVAEIGLSRYDATYAEKLATFEDDNEDPISVNIGDRFSTISTDNPLIYSVTKAYTDINNNPVAGSYILTCETLGTDGNGYTGNLLPITYIEGLTTAVMSTLITPAEDEEDDETLRTRYFNKVRQKAFGGNIAQYKEYFDEIDGVGSAQIYPVWDGGGTVKCSIIDTSYNPCSTEFINSVQLLIDPLTVSGQSTTGKGLGYAPIGHEVTVVTPTERTLNISGVISLKDGYTLSAVQANISVELNKYILELKKAWANGNSFGAYSTTIYWAKVSSVIINTEGVANVTSLTINSGTSDIVFTENGTTQQLPKLGTVTITTA